MSVLFGTTQGRLVPSASGGLQCFPQHSWERELSLIERAGLDYVEWLVEREHNPDNPIWLDHGIDRMREVTSALELTFHSAINDFLLDVPLERSAEALAQSLRLVERMGRLGMRKLVLPLLEASVPSATASPALVGPVREIADAGAAAGMTVCLETVLPAPHLLDLIAAVDRPNVWVCFDTGNRAALRQDICADLRLLGAVVSHVHIKDKDEGGTNVLLGSGLVNFLRVAEALAEIGYVGAYTFETTRGRDPFVTAVWHRQMLEFLLAETGNVLRDRTPNRPTACPGEQLVEDCV